MKKSIWWVIFIYAFEQVSCFYDHTLQRFSCVLVKSSLNMRAHALIFLRKFVFYYKCSAFVVCVNLISCVCHAADLGSAKVTAVKNIVTFKSPSESKDADVGQRVVEGECVMTRDSSLAEITADDSSIIRIGPLS